ncbi:MAG: response regulator [Candidatus Hydrogenedentes bacterium]|nr:response regulator [Candidatus Hydrogenedentota bacterium]
MVSAGKILVVDDEAVIRDLMTDILAGEGFAVETCASGPAALHLLNDEGGFILLFTDIMMPEMDGIELIREARKVAPSVIPIVMTGYATLETARAAVKEGAYDYVLKPFSLSEIKLAVSNAFERHRLSNEVARLREITQLFNISEAIARIHDEERLVNFVLRAALERVGAERGSLMLTTPDGQGLEIAASVGVPEDAAKTVVKVGTGISGWVAQNIKPLLVEDIQKIPEVAEISRRLERDPSFISVPLERKPSSQEHELRAVGEQPRVLAVLNVSRKKEGGQFTEGDLKTLSIVANHAAVAIENVRLINDLEQAHLATLQSMALLLEAKDPYTHGHSQRVRDYSVIAARRLGMSDRDIETLRLGAALHDIGKIGVKDAVLNKEGPLTPEEWEMIKRHPVIGYDVLVPVQFLTPEHLALVRSHHERVDGKGYPDGLQGDQLSPLVRVIAVADAYDAMSSGRAYRKVMPNERIVGELKRCSGSQFDPKVAQTFVALVEAGQLRRSLPAAAAV